MEVEFIKMPGFDLEVGENLKLLLHPESVIYDTLEKCDQEFNLGNFIVDLKHYPSASGDPLMCIGGGAYKPRRISLEFYNNIVFSPTETEPELIAATAHEYAHCGRFAFAPSLKRNTIWEGVVEEGACIHFQRSIFPQFKTLEKKVSDNHTSMILERLAKDKNKNEVLLEDIWKYGEGDLPRAAFSKAAEVVVGEHLKKENLTLKELLVLDPKNVSLPSL